MEKAKRLIQTTRGMKATIKMTKDMAEALKSGQMVLSTKVTTRMISIMVTVRGHWLTEDGTKGCGKTDSPTAKEKDLGPRVLSTSENSKMASSMALESSTRKIALPKKESGKMGSSRERSELKNEMY